MSSSPSITFTVSRKPPELIRPAVPTPYELKPLSDIDDQEGLRFHIPNFFIYRHNSAMAGRDPVQAIRNGLAGALVHYYPLAGRLREGAKKKLVVECTGEGILFVEADADVRLEQFGEQLRPPFPCFEELLYNVEGSDGIVGCPLLLIQVNRLLCGGFIFAVRINHTVCDGMGVFQFLNAVAEMARGASQPSVPPVWRRELLRARDPPRITREHREYDPVPDDAKNSPGVNPDMVGNSFFFGPRELAALRKQLPAHLHKHPTFEVITACAWKCRTIAKRFSPEDEVRLLCAVDARAKCNLPTGYYGNAIAFSAVATTAGKLCGSPLGYAVELVRKAKTQVDGEHMQSLADLLVLRNRCYFTVMGSFIVSNVMRVGFDRIDLGWGRPVYGGPAMVDWLGTFHIPWKNKEGEEGTSISLAFPAHEMDRFVDEIRKMTCPDGPVEFTRSAL